MKLEEAINELQNQCCVPNSEFHKPQYQARALGIEALRFRLRCEQKEGQTEFPLLPGETKPQHKFPAVRQTTPGENTKEVSK